MNIIVSMCVLILNYLQNYYHLRNKASDNQENITELVGLVWEMSMNPGEGERAEGKVRQVREATRERNVFTAVAGLISIGKAAHFRSARDRDASLGW